MNLMDKTPRPVFKCSSCGIIRSLSDRHSGSVCVNCAYRV